MFDNNQQQEDKIPPNAFILFMRSIRQTIIQDVSSGVTEETVDPIIGKMWQGLPEDSKNVYREQAKEIAEKFRAEHPDYPDKKVKRSPEFAKKPHPEPIHVKVIFDNEATDQGNSQISDDPLSILKLPQKEVESEIHTVNFD
ncbi:HMG box family protein [Histomonas meleagridis]|uniref:HMG box family protein n=1 Tax=Histomonas meleagridis TaxID=135588 RepID=UPI00355A62DB|nr:HMG box family protein [Histomonas meleagridis]KAH0805302.1 HMG box family protein [Histomonas meleagridis]